MQTIHLNLFGPARDFAGAAVMPIELADGATVGDLMQRLGERFPEWRIGLQSVRFAIDDAFVTAAHKLSEGDHVAVIPPVSGGMSEPQADLIVLTPLPLDIAHCYAHLAASSTGDGGGVCVFVGKTRAESSDDHGPLKCLDYEAHETMAIAQMKNLANEGARDGRSARSHCVTGLALSGSANHRWSSGWPAPIATNRFRPAAG
ncbi:MAG: MoaD/ThiS family protein [Phycisphaerae bacterium]